MDARPGHIALDSFSDELKSAAALSREVRRMIEERKLLLYRHMEISYRQFYSDERKKEGAMHRRIIDALMGELQREQGYIVRDEPPHRPGNDKHHDEYRWIIYWGECPWCGKSANQIQAR